MKLRTRKKETTQTETHVLLLSYFIFFLLFIGVGIGMYFLYLETGSIHGTVFAGSMSSVIILLIIWGLFAGKFNEEQYKTEIKLTKKSVSNFLTVIVIIIFSIGIITPFILLGIYVHKAFLLFIFILLSPILFEIRSKCLIYIKRNTLFQKVDDILLASKHFKDSNFLNHHNYFKNYELENKYSQYKRMKVIKIILGNIFLILFLVGICLIFPRTMLEFIIGPLLLFIVIILLIIKDNATRVKKNSTVKIYFRKIQATAFQKIKNKIFFY